MAINAACNKNHTSVEYLNFNSFSFSLTKHHAYIVLKPTASSIRIKRGELVLDSIIEDGRVQWPLKIGEKVKHNHKIFEIDYSGTHWGELVGITKHPIDNRCLI